MIQRNVLKFPRKPAVSLQQSHQPGIEAPGEAPWDAARESLRSAIIGGQLAPGERLVERALCVRLGVSRALVRETIRSLEAEGLVETRPDTGPTVTPLDWNRARQIYEVRLLLEAKAAAGCAARADAAAKVRLMTVYRRLGEAYSRRDIPALLAGTRDFDRIRYEVAGMEVAWEGLQCLNAQTNRLRAISMPQLRLAAGDQVKRTYETIFDNDPDTAAASARENLRIAAEIVRHALKAPTTG